MITFVYPQQDTFVSNHKLLKYRNFGKDEVLEIGKGSTDECGDHISRALIQFDLSSISQSIATGKIVDPKFYLKLYTVEAFETPIAYDIIANPISQSWVMGTGRLFDDDTIVGASWKYRDTYGGQLWDSTYSPTSSYGGVTTYGTISSSSLSAPSATMNFTSYEQGQLFYVTSSNGLNYTFNASSSIQVSQSGFATSSMQITAINDFDQFIFSGSKECKLIVVNGNVPPDCGDVYYFGWDGSSKTPVEASASFLVNGIVAGDRFEIVDCETTASLIVSSNKDIVAPPCSNLQFFYSASNVVETANSMSQAINSVSDFYITASVSSSYSSSISASVSSSFTSSYVIMNSVDSGEGGNKYYLWDIADTTLSESLDICGNPLSKPVANKLTLAGGKYTGLKTRFYALVGQLNEISSSCGFTFNTTKDMSLLFTSSVSGLDGNSYYFQSGSTTSSFAGGVASSSLTVVGDDVANRVYHFATGSTVEDSVSNLNDKLNSVLTFVSSSASASVLTVSATDDYLLSQNIGLQSGSSQVKLSGAKITTSLTSSVSQSFNNQSSDINMNVTDIVNSWLIGATPNNGFELKSSEENSSVVFGGVKFFAQDTNTIYIPHLAVKWDDSVRTGSLVTATESDQLMITTANLKKEYISGEKARIDVFARDKFPVKTFENQFTRYNTSKKLPVASYYAIQDAHSEEYLIDFDVTGTKLSVDDNGNYFILDTTNFPQERYFKVVIKVVFTNSTIIVTDNKAFKISI
jgi:hypothetical protein